MTLPRPPIDNALAERLDRPLGRRAALLGALFLLTPCIAWWTAPLLGVDGGVRGLLALSFPLVVIVGYQLWWTRMMAAATSTFGRRLKQALWQVLVRKESIEGRTDLLPTPEDVRQLAIQTLNATGIFRTVARIAALGVGLAVGFAANWMAALVVTIALIGWGQWLAALGSDGWLPIPEGE
jgi:hypothetical protein